MAKNNPAAVAAITAAQQQLASQMSKPQSPGSSLAGNSPQVLARDSQIPTPAGPPPTMPLPEYQIIYQDPPEQYMSSSTHWSDMIKRGELDVKEASSDLLVYEQILKRDRENSEQLKKERAGFEPFSKYGFSHKEYLTRLLQDLNYMKEVKAARMKSITATTQGAVAKSIWGDGYSGYGNGFSNTVTNVSTGVAAPGGRQLMDYDIRDVYHQAMNEMHEELVPVRLEFDAERDNFSLRDVFMWNKNESIIKIEDLVTEMLRDYRFRRNDQFFETVVQSIREQINEFQPDPFVENDREFDGGDDMRVKIQLDIVVGQNQLIDAFEWDISNPDNNPEEFAEAMSQELELPGEFSTAIAHSIREQVHMYHKSLVLTNYQFDGSVVDDEDIRGRFLPLITLDEVFRNSLDVKVFTPNLLKVSYTELERLDRDKDRDTRRKRRQGRFNRRGAGPSANAAQNESSLPDLSDVPKTFRIPIPSSVLPGGVDLGPSVNSYNTFATTEYFARPPEPIVQEAGQCCRIIDHNPGQYLLIGIKHPSIAGRDTLTSYNM